MPGAVDFPAPGTVASDCGSPQLVGLLAERTGPTYSIKGSFLLARLHTHPRFRALLRQMKLDVGD